jgi:S-DNA-T family DNA segregation ATPase FtsK/SpoIIIE
VITRALGSLGIAGIDRWLRDGRELVFPSPVREDGPGWRAEVDLPYGVTAAMVIDRREQLASGLRRPLGAVWPEPVTSEHAGRVELWVGRQDVAKARQAPWPLLRGGQADIFQPIPYGTDVRGRVVKAPLIYGNWLIGAIPRQGKTAAVRVLACAVALDPLAEMWVHELKGSGDLDPLEKVAHRFVSGVDAPSIGYAAESLRLLRAEVMRRTERLKALDRAVCPDKRVTRQIAAKASLRLRPLVCFIDEAQNLFIDPEHGKAAGADAEFIIKIGPAFGVILVIATQRPDQKSLPTGVSGNVSTRFCLKVMGQVENDMILGTSAYKNGLKATTFRHDLDAGIGYLLGAGPAPQVVRTFYLDMHAAERVAIRARALREAAGTLTGHALEDAGEGPRDVLTDVLAVFGSDAGLQWVTSRRGSPPGSRPAGTAPAPTPWPPNAARSPCLRSTSRPPARSAKAAASPMSSR